MKLFFFQILTIDPCLFQFPTVMKVSEVDVLIRQSVIGVNYMDVYQRSDYYPMDMLSGIRLEAFGIIQSIGAGIDYLT